MFVQFIDRYSELEALSRLLDKKSGARTALWRRSNIYISSCKGERLLKIAGNSWASRVFNKMEFTAVKQISEEDILVNLTLPQG